MLEATIAVLVGFGIFTLSLSALRHRRRVRLLAGTTSEIMEDGTWVFDSFISFAVAAGILMGTRLALEELYRPQMLEETREKRVAVVAYLPVLELASAGKVYMEKRRWIVILADGKQLTFERDKLVFSRSETGKDYLSEASRWCTPTMNRWLHGSDPRPCGKLVRTLHIMPKS